MRDTLRMRSESGSNLGNWLAPTLLGVYVVVASVSPYLYGNLLAVLVVTALGWLVVRHWFPPAVTWVWPLALSGLGLFGFLIGIANDNPGAKTTISIFVIEPVVLGVAFALASRERGWRLRVLGILDIATVAVFVAGVWIYLARHLGLPVPTAIYGTRFTAVDMMGLIRTNYQGFNAFVFLAPYAVARFLRPLDEPMWRRALLLVAGVGGVILSGRQVLFLLVPAVVVACLGLATLQRLRGRSAKQRPRALDVVGASGALLIVVAIVLGNQLLVSGEKRVAAEWAERRAAAAKADDSDPLGSETPPKRKGQGGRDSWAGPEVDAADRTQRESPSPATTEPAEADAELGIRAEQSQRLLNSWQQSPWIGHGSGAAVPGYARSDSAPWRFELSYHVVLLNFGLLGALMLAAWTLWTAIPMLSASLRHDRIVQAVTAGWVGALVANVTNPYLLKIDGMWMVMVPFGLAVALRRPLVEQGEGAT